MDPVSAIGLVGACFSLATKIPVVVKDLYNVREKFKTVEQSTDFLISKIKIVGTSVKTLSLWLERGESARPSASDLEENLLEAVKFCTVVIEGITLHVSWTSKGVVKPGVKDRVRFVWNESTINEHVRKLDSQIHSLSHLLQVIQFTEEYKLASRLEDEETVNIFKTAKDDAMSYVETTSRLNDDMVDAVFDFDDDVVRSGPYINHYRKLVGENVKRETRPIPGIASTHKFHKVATQLSPTDATFTIQRDSTGIPTSSKTARAPIKRLPSKSWLSKAGSFLSQYPENYSKELLKASSEGNLYEMSRLIRNGADVNFKLRSNGKSALHKAAYHRHQEAMILLLRSGAIIDLQSKTQETPLYILSNTSSISCLQTLIDAGADVQLANHEGYTPLHNAASRGGSKAVQCLIKAGAIVNSKNRQKITPLHMACGKGDAEVIQLLINAGASLNIQARASSEAHSRFSGMAPIHIVCSNTEFNGAQIVTMVEILVQAGAKVNIPKADYDVSRIKVVLPFHMALENDHQGVVLALMKSGDDLGACTEFQAPGFGTHDLKLQFSSLHIAAIFNAKSSIRTLLKEDANVNKDAGHGWVPLHTAALVGAVQAAEILLENGGDRATKVFPKTKKTPLHIAARQGHATVTLALLEHGTEVSEVSDTGRTALHYAALGTKEGRLITQYPLEYFESKDHLRVMSLLIEKGSDVNARDNERKTPLQLLRGRSHFSSPSRAKLNFARLLIKHGAKTSFLSGRELRLLMESDDG